MVVKEDRLSLTVGNWIALAALAVVPLFTVIGGWVDMKSESASMRVELRQVRDDVAELKQALRNSQAVAVRR